MLSVSQIQTKGLDFVMKAVSREYPYIVGWELEDLSRDYTIYINLLVDLKKALKFYGKPLDTEIGPYHRKEGTSLLPSAFEANISPFGDEKEAWEIQFKERYDDKSKLQKTINNLYEQIPKTFQVENPYKKPVSISVSYFKFT